MSAEMDERPVTDAEMSKASTFVRERLQPDLRAAQDALAATEAEKGAYMAVSDHLVEVRQRMHRTTEDEAFVHGSRVLASGIAVPTRYNAANEVVVSLGLGDLYLPMSQAKARSYIGARIKQLDKRADRQKDKVASIQAVMELTTATLSKLDALRSGRDGSVVQDVPADAKQVSA